MNTKEILKATKETEKLSDREKDVAKHLRWFRRSEIRKIYFYIFVATAIFVVALFLLGVGLRLFAFSVWQPEQVGTRTYLATIILGLLLVILSAFPALDAIVKRSKMNDYIKDRWDGRKRSWRWG